MIKTGLTLISYHGDYDTCMTDIRFNLKEKRRKETHNHSILSHTNKKITLVFFTIPISTPTLSFLSYFFYVVSVGRLRSFMCFFFWFLSKLISFFASLIESCCSLLSREHSTESGFASGVEISIGTISFTPILCGVRRMVASVDMLLIYDL